MQRKLAPDRIGLQDRLKIADAGVCCKLDHKLARASRLDSFDQLDLVAQIAVALLGFFAVFLALSKTDGRFSESDRHFIQALVLSSSIAVLLAIVPRAINLFGPRDSIWFISSILAIAVGSLAMFVQGRQQLRMTREEAAQIHWLWHVVAWAIAVACAVLFVFAVIDRSLTVPYYVSGVTLLVPLCIWVFIGVVFRRFF